MSAQNSAPPGGVRLTAAVDGLALPIRASWDDCDINHEEGELIARMLDVRFAGHDPPPFTARLSCPDGVFVLNEAGATYARQRGPARIWWRCHDLHGVSFWVTSRVPPRFPAWLAARGLKLDPAAWGRDVAVLKRAGFRMATIATPWWRCVWFVPLSEWRDDPPPARETVIEATRLAGRPAIVDLWFADGGDHDDDDAA